MSYSHQVKKTIFVNGQPIVGDNSYSANMSTGIDETIPAGAATTFSNFDVDVSEVESLVMLCDRDVTIAINDDGTPDATISLKAGKPLDWQADGYFANPLGSVDVTSIKATLAAGEDATLHLEVLQDPTP